MLQEMLNGIFPVPNLLRLNRLGQRTGVGYGYSVMGMAGVLDMLAHVVRRPVLAVFKHQLCQSGWVYDDIATNQIK
jgi:hypothetical protein